MPAFDLSILDSPQARSTTYAHTPRFDTQAYMTGLASRAADLQHINDMKRIQDEEQEFLREQQVAMNRSANRQLALDTASLGTTALMHEKVFDSVTKPAFNGATEWLGWKEPAAAAGKGATAIDAIGAGSEVATNTASAGTAANAGSSALGSAVGTGLKFAGNAAAGYGTAKTMKALGANEDIASGVGAAAGAWGGWQAGATAGTLFGPAGTLVGGTVGAIGGLLSGAFSGQDDSKCIIVTACTDRFSPEVVVARTYRDAYMTADQIRGYYMLADHIVPVLHRYDSVKHYTYTYFVQPLVAYGEHALRYTADQPSRYAKWVTRTFLGLCNWLGKQRTTYTRSTGETY